jgi:hypothetical protein
MSTWKVQIKKKEITYVNPINLPNLWSGLWTPLGSIYLFLLYDKKIKKIHSKSTKY